MSNLNVVIFEDEQSAGMLRQAIREAEQTGKITVDDAAVVVKDADGKIHVKHETSKGVKSGAVGGSLLGLLLGSVFFPLAGLLTGAVGGAIVGKIAGAGVDRKFAQEVANEMKPGNSALFVISHDSDPAYIRAMLEPYEGRLFHTTVSREAEDQLREALRQRS